ncbi:MAG: hypothetical protein WA869_13360 [Alloacidobacterium sp.]
MLLPRTVASARRVSHEQTCLLWSQGRSGSTRFLEARSGGVLPGALLVLMPKCPMCVVAYIALATGVGVSVSTATYLREGVLVLCIVALGYLAGEVFSLESHSLGRMGRYVAYSLFGAQGVDGVDGGGAARW